MLQPKSTHAAHDWQRLTTVFVLDKLKSAQRLPAVHVLRSLRVPGLGSQQAEHVVHVDVVVLSAKLSEHKCVEFLFASNHEEHAAGAHELPWWPGRRRGSVGGHQLTNAALQLRLRRWLRHAAI